MKKPPLRSFRAESFKAIRDSGTVELGWLTAFIGNNGVGKSSLMEALETFRAVVLDDVDPAFHRWRGFEHVWNKARDRTLIERLGHRPGYTHPLRFRCDWKFLAKQWKLQQSITQGPGGDSLFIQQEQIIQRKMRRTERWTRSDNGLDPRTLHLLVEEIRAAIDAGTTQVILTTHSPYLLDLLDLSHIVVVEREEGQATFKRPNKSDLAEWSKSFSPGRLYTMGRLTRHD